MTIHVVFSYMCGGNDRYDATRNDSENRISTARDAPFSNQKDAAACRRTYELQHAAWREGGLLFLGETLRENSKG